MPVITLIGAIAMFGMGCFGVGCLAAMTFLLFKHVAPQDKPLLTDLLLVQMSAGLCLLIECATLVWDVLTPYHFPSWIRWPLLCVVVPTVTRCAFRLLKHYLAQEAVESTEAARSASV